MNPNPSRNFNRDGNLGACQRVAQRSDTQRGLSMGGTRELSDAAMRYTTPLERRVDEIMRAARSRPRT